MRLAKIDIEALRSYIPNQADVADRIGKTPMWLSYKLAGKRRMHLDDLNEICKVIERDPEEFVVFKQESNGKEKAA